MNERWKDRYKNEKNYKKNSVYFISMEKQLTSSNLALYYANEPKKSIADFIEFYCEMQLINSIN